MIKSDVIRSIIHGLFLIFPGKISHFKLPKYIRFVNEFPMTVTGKLKKFEMRKVMVGVLEN